jgi:hypothetical protein
VHHASVLLELWLADAPVIAVWGMLASSLAGSPNYPEYRKLIAECWRERGNERRYTVPVKIKRKLCRLAIAHVMELRLDSIERHNTKDLLTMTPDVDEVLALVNRSTPRLTLRRKAACRN